MHQHFIRVWHLRICLYILVGYCVSFHLDFTSETVLVQLDWSAAKFYFQFFFVQLKKYLRNPYTKYKIKRSTIYQNGMIIFKFLKMVSKFFVWMAFYPSQIQVESSEYGALASK